jgi:hypothetical protein
LVLNQISSIHVSVFGYSANNYTARVLSVQQRPEFDFSIFGGLTEVLIALQFFRMKRPKVNISSCSLFVREQSEYDQWCLTNKKVFESVDASELDQCKSQLRLASGGNPLLLNSFCRRFESMVRYLQPL